MLRTRIKICGLTRSEDVLSAVQAGADALGFVFYPKSPRYQTPEQARRLIASVPPFVSTVGLFVNASAQQVVQVLLEAAVSLLQFHGDETPEQCAEIAALVNRPFMTVLRVRPDTTGADLLEYELRCRTASPLFAGLLLDTHVDSYGGGGKVFDWSIIPAELAPRVVLSGGLDAQNATDAVARVRPHAVDVSSGVERLIGSTRTPGIKDATRVAAFVAAVRAADAALKDS
ncbi:MAG: phosphoribosylanthranilate isomerase [Pseudomonadota bacterium]